MAEYRDIEDGGVVLVQGSAAKPYEVKNVGGVYSCTCPAWRNQSKTIDARTCKHIRGIRGEAAEVARVGEAAKAPARKSTSGATAAPVLLAQKWEPHVDLTGWWLSEKLDGVRAYWTGSEILSRLGNRFVAPDWFVDPLGDKPLDGELWVGRGLFQESVGIVRRGDKSELWRKVKFLLFDCPGHGGVFEERIEWLKSNFSSRAEHIEVVEHFECRGTDHVAQELKRIEGLGGEGLMARKPKSVYIASRSATLLKIKTFLDDEAIVVGYVAGAGRHKGRVGSLEAELKSGVRFNVGTGLSDVQRENPPEIGSIITVRFQELTRDGVPRFPSFVGVRDDVEWKGKTPEPAKKAAEKKPAAAKKPAVAKKPAAAKKPSGAKAASTPTSDKAGARMFEFKDEKSNKFWEIWVTGKCHTVRFGRIGANGTEKTKEFGSEAEAQKAADKLIGQKTRKGYVEV